MSTLATTDPFDDDGATGIEAAHTTTAAEHDERGTRAVVDRDGQQRGVVVARMSCATDLARHANRLALGRLADVGQPEPGEALLQSGSVEFLDRGTCSRREVRWGAI